MWSSIVPIVKALFTLKRAINRLEALTPAFTRIRGKRQFGPNGVGVRHFVLSRDGVVAVEFVLVFPVFMLCLFSITAFASVLFIENNMLNAARESVRIMAVREAPFSLGAVQCGSTEAQIVGSVEYIACAYLTPWGTDFTVNASTDCPAEDKATVQITVDASQAALADVFGFFDGKTLSARVSMRKEDNCV